MTNQPEQDLFFHRAGFYYIFKDRDPETGREYWVNVLISTAKLTPDGSWIPTENISTEGLEFREATIPPKTYLF